MRTPTEDDILVALLLYGDKLPMTIAEKTGRHPKSISRYVPSLVDEGLVVEVGRSVYGLTPEGYAEARSVMRRRADRS